MLWEIKDVWCMVPYLLCVGTCRVICVWVVLNMQLSYHHWRDRYRYRCRYSVGRSGLHLHILWVVRKLAVLVVVMVVFVVVVVVMVVVASD